MKRRATGRREAMEQAGLQKTGRASCETRAMKAHVGAREVRALHEKSEQNKKNKINKEKRISESSAISRMLTPSTVNSAR